MLQHGLIHLANLVYLASYSVKDIRWLRWLTIVGIVLLIPYYLVWGLYAAAIWNGVFLAINLVRLFQRRLVVGLPNPDGEGDVETTRHVSKTIASCFWMGLLCPIPSSKGNGKRWKDNWPGHVPQPCAEFVFLAVAKHKTPWLNPRMATKSNHIQRPNKLQEPGNLYPGVQASVQV